MWRFVALSSTISTRLPASCDGLRPLEGPGGRGGGLGLDVKWKVDPLPDSLSTHIVPPIRSASRLLIARPSPVPP